MQMPSYRPLSPCVSVIIAAYNCQETLVRAVRSALVDPAALEVLVVDDASTDDSLRVAHQLAAQDERVRVLSGEANGGPSVARNRGIAAAQGEWVAILDADDAFLPGRLHRLAAIGARHDADLLCDNLFFFDWGAQRMAGRALDMGDEDVVQLRAADFVANAITGRSPFDYGQLKPMIRRRFLQSRCLRYPPDLRHGEDFALFLDCLLADARFLLVGEAMYLFTQRIGSISAVRSGQSRTVLNLHAMREHTLALLARPRVREDRALRRLLVQRAAAIRDQASWNRVYPFLRARQPVGLMRAMIGDWRNFPMLARHLMRRRAAQRSSLSSAPLS